MVLNPILVAVFYQEKMGSMALVGAGIVIFGVISYNLLKIRQDTKELST
jgi:Na+/H+ antiporter NhaA